MRLRYRMKKILSAALAVCLTLSFFICVSPVTVFSVSAERDEIPEWAIDDDFSDADAVVLLRGKRFPETLDLRDYGVVTPVKNQGSFIYKFLI